MNTITLQKLKYDSINFERLHQLRAKFMSSNFNPKEVKELNLIKCNSQNLPPLRCLELLPNLVSINLSQNQIDRFEAAIITKGAPLLVELHLADNEISTMDDLIDLGGLKSLSTLNFSNNPINATLRRVPMLQMLLFPSKYQKFNPVEVLTATYNEIPNPKLSKKEEEAREITLRYIQKHDVEVSNDDLKKNMKKASKYNHKYSLSKFAIDECPVNRKSRFPNLRLLYNEPITKLEMLRASGASNIQDILKSESTNNLPTQANFTFKRQNSALNEVYINRYKKRMQRLLASQEPLIYMSKDKAVTAAGLGKFTGGTNDDDLKYLARLDEISNIRRKNKLDPKKYSAELWEKPKDLQHKNAQFNISISDYKKMLEDYDKNKILKQKEMKKRKEKYLGKMLGKKKHEQRKKKLKELENEKEQDSDPEIRKIFKLKRRIIKPKLNLEMNLDKEYDTSESDASENLSRSNENNYFNEPETSQSEIKEPEMEKSEETIGSAKIIPKKHTPGKPIEERFFKDTVKKSKIILFGGKQNDKSPEVKNSISSVSKRSSIMNKRKSEEEVKDKEKTPLIFSESEKDPVQKNTRQKINIKEDDLLPNEEHGMPNDLKFNIFYEREDQYYQLMNVKRLVEESENLILDCKDLDEKKDNEDSEMMQNVRKKKLTNFEKILEFLKEKDHDISEYIGPNTFLLRDIIYYVNDFKKSDEPKITEEEILKKLKQKKNNISEKELEKLYKELETIDKIKSKKKSTNDFFLKRIEQKEIERAEANAVLAAHYLKLKKYYQGGAFDKYLRQLTIEHDDMPQVITKEQTKVTPSTGINIQTLQKQEKQKKLAMMMKEQILSEETTNKKKASTANAGTRKQGIVKKWEELMEMKRNLNTHIERPDVPIDGFILDSIPNINEIVKNLKDKKLKLEPHKHFEDLVEQSLRKIQDEFHSKGSKALSLEEKMIRFAQDFKENVKKREVLKSNIEKHIMDVRPLLDEYWRIEEKEHIKRHDENYCFKNYVKKIRDEEKI